MKNVIESLKSTLKNNDTIIVACSTGPDSMCLVDLILQLDIKLNVIIAHVNHKQRKQSDEEYKYIETFCKENNLIFEGKELNNLSTINFEAEARKERYIFFNNLREKYNAKYIITAHHSDDLIETVLMRIFRGSNLSGYSGIKIIDNNYYRPLLLTTKDNILVYLKENNIKYYHDVTNDEDIHTRNRLRHNVLPFIKEVFKDSHNKINEFSKELIEYNDFVNSYINNKQLINNNCIDLDLLKKEKNIIKKKCIEILIENIQKEDWLEISKDVVSEIISVIDNSKPNVTIDLNNDYVAIKEYSKLYIQKKETNKNIENEYSDFYEDENYIIKSGNSSLKNNYVIRLNSKEIKLPLIIRTRRPGDVIDVKNLGHKKVKDILIDEKVPMNMRSNILLVTDQNDEILWIVGIKKSKFDKPETGKYDIILTGERKQQK